MPPVAMLFLEWLHGATSHTRKWIWMCHFSTHVYEM
jgi:hypothetical protein